MPPILLNDTWWHLTALVPPAVLVLAALLAARVGTPRAWPLAQAGTAAALLAAVAALAALPFTGASHGVLLRHDVVGATVSLLVAFIGWVIARYSATYLQGEAGEGGYVRWLLATLASALLVLAANHLLLLALAWWSTSFALHRLLLFFGARPAARIAAHKKFLLARTADVVMLGACACLQVGLGTLQIDTLAARTVAAPLPLVAQAGVVLVALAAILKCAQLPFHGWLIQVMEAPTPVSALLHAGVVNLGGFVLLRLGSLVEGAPAAQLLLVVVGTATAVLAALVMTTRISIKVALAWSTCAQMGFMVMECGLGLWDLALLHLVTHSLYKAHAFLGAGGTVRRLMVTRLGDPVEPATARQAALAALAGMLAVAAAAALWRVPSDATPAMLVMAGILALALAPLFTPRVAHLAWGSLAAFAIAVLYFGAHALLGAVVPPAGDSPWWWIPAIAFAALYAVQAAIRAQATWTRHAYPWFYGGLYLDDAVTRLLFRWSAPES